MPELFNEVVLRASAAGSVQKPRSWLKRLFGDAHGELRSFSECHELIENVQQFARLMSKRLVRDDEMPRNLILVSRVNYFVGQVLNGDVEQFLHNTGYSSLFMADVIEALQTVGAQEHSDVMAKICDFVENARAQKVIFDADQLEQLKERLEAEHLSDAKLNSRYFWLKQENWSWDDRWSAPIYLCARYIKSWRNLRVAPDESYELELNRLAARIPDLAARQKSREDARPWEKKAIERLMNLHEDKVHYTAFSARPWNENRYWCWNFTTTPGKACGHHGAIFVDGEIIIFRGMTDEIVARAPAPECALGSAVPRNHPKNEPGALGRNQVIHINNN